MVGRTAEREVSVALTEKRRQAPSRPFSWCSPCSVKEALPPSIMSRTVEEAQSSPFFAFCSTRAARLTAMLTARNG